MKAEIKDYMNSATTLALRPIDGTDITDQVMWTNIGLDNNDKHAKLPKRVSFSNSLLLYLGILQESSKCFLLELKLVMIFMILQL